MKYFLITMLLAGLIFSCNSQKGESTEQLAPPLQAKAVSVVTGKGVKSSSDAMMAAYFRLSDALVIWDTVEANKAAVALASAADSIDLTGTPDSSLIQNIRDLTGTIRAEAAALAGETDITEKRHAFNMITDNLYPLLQAVQYDGQKLYYQACPMAFNDNDSGFWISNKAEIVNPYLGTKHPKYASGMLHCGDNIDSLHFSR